MEVDTTNEYYMYKILSQREGEVLLDHWVMFVESNNSAVGFYNVKHDIRVFATPFYDGLKYIPVEINIDGEYKAFEPLVNKDEFYITRDPELDVRLYFGFMTRTLQKIEKQFIHKGGEL